MSNQDYSVRQLIEMGACTNCQICSDICPAVTASGDGELSAVYRMKGLKDILESRSWSLKKLLGKKGPSEEECKQYSETVFRCTLCGNCQEICPVGINLKDLWISLRQDLVHSGQFPKKIKMIKENLKESRNVFDEDNEERAEWVEDMRDPPDHGYIKEQAEVVYFTGCVAAYFPLAQKIPITLSEILEASGTDFTLLGEDEWCCGFPLFGAGLQEMFTEFMEHNIEAVKKKGAKEVIFACPSCYHMWNEPYPKEFRIFHASQYLEILLKEKKVPLKEVPLKVTYHDPCDLGRAERVFPRRIKHPFSPAMIHVILAGLKGCLMRRGNLSNLFPELSW